MFEGLFPTDVRNIMVLIEPIDRVIKPTIAKAIATSEGALTVTCGVQDWTFLKNTAT